MEQEIQPAVGMGATVYYPQDRYPMVITRVSESGKTFWAVPLKTVSLTTGHEPARFDGPFPVWSHVYTDEELVSLAYTPEELALKSGGYYAGAGTVERRVTLTKRGWTSGGTHIEPGKATYHRNYSY